MREESEEEIMAIDLESFPIPLLSVQNVVNMYNPENTISETASAIGVDRAQLSRWIQNGLQLHEAENLAQKIGLHPSYIWGPEYHIVVYMVEIVNEIKENKRLVKQRMNQRKKRDAQKKISRV